MKKYLFILVLILLALTQANSQVRCGFDDVLNTELGKDPKYSINIEEINAKIEQQIMRQKTFNSVDDVVYIPVVFHILHRGGAVGAYDNPTDASVISTVDYLNKVYDGTWNGAGGSIRGVGDINIKFVLATKDPDNNTTTGIKRIDASSIGDYSTSGLKRRGTSGVDEATLKNLSRWDPFKYYNIWVVHEIDGCGGSPNSCSSWTAGFAYFPFEPVGVSTLSGANARDRDGTVMLATGVSPGNALLPHEIGHALNLYHPFQGTDNTGACPPADPTAGDMCEDTDPITNPQGSWNSHPGDARDGAPYPLPNLNSCASGKPYNELTEKNFMNYTFTTRLFTADQKNRMKASVMSTIREGLSTSWANNEGTYPTTWVAPKAAVVTPVTGADGMGEYIYAGIYRVELNDMIVNSLVTNQEGGYLNNADKWYNLFSIKAGSTYTMKVNIFNGGNNNQLGVYIDYDNDGAFNETTEKIFFDTNIPRSAGVGFTLEKSITFTIPASASMSTGSIVRMRVINDLSTIYDLAPVSGSSSSLAYGQAEDYAIYLEADNAVTLSSAAGTDSQTACINTAIINITYATTGATGATFSGLPIGVSGNWSANVVTISGTPSVVRASQPYTVTLTGGSGAVTTTGTLTVISTISPSFTQVGPVCSGASLSALPTTSTNGITGTWSPVINNTATTNYTFTPSEEGPCTTTASMTITVNTLPTTAITNNTATTVLTCSTAVISVTATGGVSYAWNNSLGTNATASITAAGTYTVTVTNANGCTDTQSITITENLSYIYVNKAATGSNNGTSWADAFTDLQDAIDVNCSGVDIWVAAGTYYPTASPDGTTTDPRDKAFHLGTDMKIYGGFVGGETQLSARNAATNVTILSGDFNDNDFVTGSGSTLSFNGNAENAYHVIITADLTVAAVIDGFTIKGGNANGNGIITYQSETFYRHYSGGMGNYSSSPTITNSTFANNNADYGGGMVNFDSSPTITNSTFTNNNATDGGGGMINLFSSPTVTNSTFTNNNATGGGGMYNILSSPTITNSTFANNNASNGGGMYNSDSSSPTITNSTFANNNTSNGGGMYNYDNSSPTITNSIIWNNGSSEVTNNGSTPTFKNSIIKGSGGSASWSLTYSTDGGGNLDADPLFVDAANGNVNLQVCSPAIDAGDNPSWTTTTLNTDIAGNTRPFNSGIVDMGAYEYQGTPIVISVSAPTVTQPTCGVPSGEIVVNATTTAGTLEYSVDNGSTYQASNTFSGLSAGSYTITVREQGSSCTETYGGNPVAINPLPTLAISAPTVTQPTCAVPSGEIVVNATTTAGTLEYSVDNGSTYQASNTFSGLSVGSYTITVREQGSSCTETYGGNPVVAINNLLSYTEIYVNKTATGNNNGTSWTDAFTDLQDAIDVNCNNVDIWVAAGTYYPTASPDNISTNPRDKAFHLGTDMKIYGGFAGSETQLSARNAVANITILSGDFLGNDVVTGGGITLSITGNTENAYHVMLTADLTNAAVIDGFTIKGGNTDPFPGTITYQSRAFGKRNGGGMYNSFSSPTITNSTFANNSAGGGGGMINDNSSPTITNSTFANNSASSGGGMTNGYESSPIITNVTFTNNRAGGGGGMFNFDSSSPMITNATFTSNYAGTGGGMYNSFSSPTITNSTFANNSSISSDGGGMFNESSSSPIITNSTFTNNSARSGGGMYNVSSCSPIITNSTFTNNSARSGGGMFNNTSSSPTITNSTFTNNSASSGSGGGMANVLSSSPIITNSTFANNSATSAGGGMANSNSLPTITNTIIWNNGSSEVLNVSSSVPTFKNSIIKGSGGSGSWNTAYGTDNGANLDTDPLFVDAANSDYSLQGCSPAIDAGDNTAWTTTTLNTDIAGNTRPFNSTVDMGAYEYQGIPIAITISAPTVTQPTCAVPSGEIVVNATTTSGTLEYSIDNGSTYQASNTFSGLSAGSYTITVRVEGSVCEETYASNPVAINTLLLTYELTPSISVSQTELCVGESITLSATNIPNSVDGATIHWTGGFTGESITVSPSTSGDFRVAVRSANGCLSDSSDAVSITVNQLPLDPVITSNITSLCTGETVTLSGSCETNTVFSWIIPVENTNGATTSALSSSNQRVINAAGIYTGYCETTTGCRSGAVSIIITESTNCGSEQVIAISPAKPTICPGEVISLTASGCAGTLTWSGGPVNQNGSTASFNPVIATTYSVTCSTGGSGTVDVSVVKVNEVISSNISTGTSEVRALETIQSDKKIGDTNVTPAPNVIFQSGKSILLSPGFEVTAESIFKAIIQITCPDND
jgi:hypothetical protein